MTRIASIAILVAVGMHATSSGAHAQAMHEIEYQFNDQPAVIRTEAFPFTLSESYSPDPRGIPLRIVGLYLFKYPGIGLFLPHLSQSPRADVSLDGLMYIRMKLSADDLIFSSDQPDPIEVDLNLHFGDGFIRVSTSESAGTEFITEVVVSVDGDWRQGRSVAIINETPEPTRERTGLLSSLGETREILVENLVVPVNEPMTLTLELSGSIRVPPGVRGSYDSWGFGSQGFGYATDRPIFTVPDGVRVDSAGGRIRDNAYVPCFVDLDADGSLTVFDLLAYQQLFMDQDYTADLDGDRALTIFDFLAFQNAFDAGCP